MRFTHNLRRSWIPASTAATVMFAAAVIAVARPGVAAGVDMKAVEDTIRAAVTARQNAFKLPAGVAAGRLDPQVRRQLTDAATERISKSFTGRALTSQLANVLAWVDRVGDSPREGRLLAFSLVSVELNQPVIDGDTMTISGTYVAVEQQGHGLPDGRLATYGGTYTNQFVAQLERRGRAWKIADYSEQPVTFVPDPALESNLDVDPAPEQTKPPTP